MHVGYNVPRLEKLMFSCPTIRFPILDAATGEFEHAECNVYGDTSNSISSPKVADVDVDGQQDDKEDAGLQPRANLK